MLTREIASDDLDFSNEAMTNVPSRVGRLVRDGEKRFLVLRNTSKGLIAVAKCASLDMAEARSIAGDIITEVPA